MTTFCSRTKTKMCQRVNTLIFFFWHLSAIACTNTSAAGGSLAQCVPQQRRRVMDGEAATCMGVKIEAGNQVLKVPLREI